MHRSAAEILEEARQLPPAEVRRAGMLDSQSHSLALDDVPEAAESRLGTSQKH
jgi:hypothetical protein